MHGSRAGGHAITTTVRYSTVLEGLERGSTGRARSSRAHSPWALLSGRAPAAPETAGSVGTWQSVRGAELTPCVSLDGPGRAEHVEHERIALT